MPRRTGFERPPGEQPNLRRVTEDNFAAVIRAFMSDANPKWKEYEEGTRRSWMHELDLAAHPDCLGSVSIQSIRPALVQAFLDGLSGRPGKQEKALKALKAVERWAIVRDILPRSITIGVETGKREGGHVPWTDEQVEIAEKHARQDLARVVTLAANTGQRISDLVRMGPTDLEIYNGILGINVTQKKTGRQVWIPITSPLKAAMETWERRPGPYLLSPKGQQWDTVWLASSWGTERETNPQLAPLRRQGERPQDKERVIHGLRGTACVRLRRAGATIPQIADMVGMSTEVVAVYCRFSIQRENAVAAVLHLEKALGERREKIR